MFYKFLDKKADLLEKINPDRIYVENIRAFFNIPTKMAKFLCEMATKDGTFKKRIGVFCPNEDCNRLIIHYKHKDNIEDVIVCDTCQALERDNYEFKKNDIDINEFYQLSK